MLAAVLKPPERLDAGQVRHISKIWELLEKIFGEQAKKPEFLFKYIKYPDGRTKRAEDLAQISVDLHEQWLHENDLILYLPGKTEEGGGPAPEIK